jgi:hypothetical protein
MYCQPSVWQGQGEWSETLTHVIPRLRGRWIHLPLGTNTVLGSRTRKVSMNNPCNRNLIHRYGVRRICGSWILLLLLSLPWGAHAQVGDFAYVTNFDQTITIMRYIGFGGATSIPSMINGLPVTEIGYQAFYQCSGVTSVTIPSSVTSIDGSAFFYCTGLSTITVDEANLAYSSVAGVLFNKSQTTLVLCPGGKAGSYTVPNSVTNIAGGAFYYCGGLTSVTLPNSVT